MVSWEAKPDPPTGDFHYEITGRYVFPLDRGVEAVMPAVPSHFLLLASRDGFRSHGRGDVTTGCAAFDLRTGKVAAMIKDDEFADSRGPMAISPDGVYVVDGTGTADLRVWSLEKRALFRTLRRKGREGPRIAFFLDPTRLLTVTGNSECLVEVFSVKTGEPITAFQSLKDRSGHARLTSHALSPGAHQIALLGGQTLHILDLNEGREVGRTNLAPFSGRGTLEWFGLAFRSDGRQIAAVGYSSDQFRVACWDMETGNALVDYVADLPQGSRLHSLPESLAWLPDGELLVVGGKELIDAATGRPLGPLPDVPPGACLAIDSRRFVTVQPSVAFQPGAITLVTIPGQEEIARRRRVQAQEEEPRGAGPKLTKANLSDDVRTQAPATAVDWTATFAVCEMPDDLLPKPIPVGKSGLAFRSMAFNKSHPQTVALVHGSKPTAGEAVSLPSRSRKQAAARAASGPACWIEAIDLTACERVTSINLPGFYDVLGLSMDATLAVLGLDEADPQSAWRAPSYPNVAGRSSLIPTKGYERLDIWSLQTGSHALGFRPYAGEPEDRAVTWCAFLDKRHALTINRAGLLVKWEFPSCQAEYALDGFGQVAGFSPDRRYVIGWMPETDVFRVVDAQSGECQGELHVGEKLQSVDAAAISACGRQFAAIVQTKSCRLIAWELVDGSLAVDMVFSRDLYGSRPHLTWVDPSYVVLAGRYLMDLDRSTTAWQYTLGQGMVAPDSCDGRLWTLLSGTGGAVYRLGAARVPSRDVRAKIAHLELGDQVTFRPGVPVSLSVQASVPGAGDAVKILTDALQEQGIPVQPSADLVLEYRAHEKATGVRTEYEDTTGKSRIPPANLTVNERAIQVSVRLAYRDGLELWKNENTVHGYASMFVYDDPQTAYNQNFQQQFTGILRSFRLPAYIFLPTEKLGAGASRLDQP